MVIIHSFLCNHHLVLNVVHALHISSLFSAIYTIRAKWGYPVVAASLKTRVFNDGRYTDMRRPEPHINYLLFIWFLYDAHSFEVVAIPILQNTRSPLLLKSNPHVHKEVVQACTFQGLLAGTLSNLGRI